MFIMVSYAGQLFKREGMTALMHFSVSLFVPIQSKITIIFGKAGCQWRIDYNIKIIPYQSRRNCLLAISKNKILYLV